MALYPPEKIVTVEFYRVILEFLSLVFLQTPEPDIVDQLVTGNPFGGWPVDSQDPDLKNGLALLEGFCATWQPQEIDLLRQDFSALFEGVDQALVPPYESVHLAGGPDVFDPQTLAVRAYYERYGLKVPLKDRLPDDHLSYEFQFLATFCDQLVEAWRIRDAAAITALLDDALTFMTAHPLRWLPTFSSRVSSLAQSDFYRGMALLALATVRGLQDYLRYLK